MNEAANRSNKAWLTLAECSYRLTLAATRLAYGLTSAGKATRQIDACSGYLARVRAVVAAGEGGAIQALGLATSAVKLYQHPRLAAILLTTASQYITRYAFYAPLEAEVEAAIRAGSQRASAQAEAEMWAVFRKVLYR